VDTVKLVTVVLALLVAFVLVAASVAATLYVTSDSRSGIAHSQIDSEVDGRDEARYVCEHTNAAAVEVEYGYFAGQYTGYRRFEC
jgi:hypothetical protein